MASKTIHVRPGAKSRANDALAVMTSAFTNDDPAYFTTHQMKDPAWSPDQTRLLEVGGATVAHLWVADRTMRYGDARIPFGGIADVCTHPDHRRRGYCGRLLDEAIAMMAKAKQPLSVLFTGSPEVYQSRGWHVVPGEWVSAKVPSGQLAEAGGISVRPFEGADLDDVLRVYQEINAHKVGPLDRSPAYWRAMQEWLPLNDDGGQVFFDVIVHVRTVVGYGITVLQRKNLRILDAGIESDVLGPSLLRAWQTHASEHGAKTIDGALSHNHPMFPVLERHAAATIKPRSGVMMRLNSLRGVLDAVQPELQRRRRRVAPLSGPTFAIRVGDEHVRLELPIAKVIVAAAKGDEPEVPLRPDQFLHLLMGLDSGHEALKSLKLPANVQVYVQRLFPNTGFDYWLADAF